MKEVRIAQAQVQLLEPEYTTDQPDLQTVLALVYEPLLHWHDGRLSPGLVAAWQIDEGGRSWKLTLREDARFHDGSPCTTEHVVQTLERLRGAGGIFGMGGVYAPYLEPLALEPQDSTRLHIKCPAPMADLADIFAAVFVGKESGGGVPALGSGPYRLEEYVEGKSIHLTRSNRSELESPYSKVTLLQIPQPQERYDALADGQVDLAARLESLPQIAEDDTLVWRRASHTLSVTAFLNGFEEPFSQPEARLAMNLAVDVHAIIQGVWHGLAEPAATVVSPYHFGFPPGLGAHRYDPERAAELFASCAMPDELVLRTPLIIPDRAPQVALLIRQQLARIGIRVRIDEETDRPKYARDVSQKRIHHMALFDSSPLSTYRVLREKVSSEVQGLWWQGVRDSTADQLIKAATQPVDEAQRQTAYARCLSWLHENPHWLYLYHPTVLYAHRPGVVGVYVDHAGIIRMG